MSNAHDLTGRVAIVTGAAGGIGSAIATELAERGALVAGWDLAGRESGSDDVTPIDVDVTSGKSVREAFVSTTDTLGAVSIVVNNAGVDVIAPFLDTDEDDWNRIIAVNLHGVFNVCRAVLPSMIAQRETQPDASATIVNERQ